MLIKWLGADNSNSVPFFIQHCLVELLGTKHSHSLLVRFISGFLRRHEWGRVQNYLEQNESRNGCTCNPIMRTVWYLVIRFWEASSSCQDLNKGWPIVTNVKTIKCTAFFQLKFNPNALLSVRFAPPFPVGAVFDQILGRLILAPTLTKCTWANRKWIFVIN